MFVHGEGAGEVAQVVDAGDGDAGFVAAAALVMQKAGSETVDGVRLTRYRAVEEIATVAAGIPGLSPERRTALER
ncbi:hypothetical protein AB0P06_36545, partial [Kitasatospora sp. NPDC088351]